MIKNCKCHDRKQEPPEKQSQASFGLCETTLAFLDCLQTLLGLYWGCMAKSSLERDTSTKLSKQRRAAPWPALFN
eukprot:1161696-Pelagomonas_calceolata.AAC.42